jgi:DNA-binding MarR family transcriptional regulator
METIITQQADAREVFQQFVRCFGLLQKDGAQCCGVSVVQSHIIYELSKNPNISLNDLSQLLSVDTSTLSRQVQYLVEKDMISRIPDPNDRRYVLLSLTTKGQQQHQQIAKLMENYLEGIFSKIAKEKRYQVLESLQLLNDAMSQSADCCTPPM